MSTVIVALGLQRWVAKRKAAANARFEAKADLSEIEQLHARITRHKDVNQAQLTKNYNAIIDLYGKHEATQTKILEAEKRSSDRFETLMTAVAGLKK